MKGKKLIDLITVILSGAVILIFGVSYPSEPVIPGNGDGDFPLAPTLINCNSVSSSQIDLVWIDNSYNEDGFKIYQRKPGDINYTNIDMVGPDTEFYSAMGLEPDTTYHYPL